MEQYTWELWDYISPINSCLPQDTGFIGQSGVYLIKNNECVVALIQDEKYRPYRELTIEECAQKQVDDMNSTTLQQTEESKHIKQEEEKTCAASLQMTPHMFLLPTNKSNFFLLENHCFFDGRNFAQNQYSLL